MKTLRSYLLMCLGACLIAPALHLSANPVKVKTSAERVTVFIDGAQVTRSKRVNIPAGRSTILFTGLSPHLDAQSMQVSAKGNVTIMGVNRRTTYLDSIAACEKQRKLQEEVKATEKQVKEQQAAVATVQSEKKLLAENCSVGNKNTAVPLATIKEINLYYSERMKALTGRERQVEEHIESLNQKLKKLRAELTQATNGKALTPVSEIAVDVDAKLPCQALFTLRYYVKNAGWYPSYDIRSGNLSEPLTLIYKANIFQNTGEDWKNVALSLSSSNPSTGNVAPELSTYWLDYGLAAPRYNLAANGTVQGIVYDGDTREPLIGAAVTIPGSTIGVVTDINGRYSITMSNGQHTLQFRYVGYETQVREVEGSVMNVTLHPDNRQLQETVVVAYGVKNALRGKVSGVGTKNASPSENADSVELIPEEEESSSLDVKHTQGQMGYEFDIQTPYTIPSGNKPTVAEIGRYPLPASYSYRCTPKIDKDAFLMAQASGGQNLNLLEGEANVYFENTFVGKTILDATQQDDTLSFSMGRDRQIKVMRVKEQEHTSGKSLGSTRTQSMAWKLSVKNTRAESVNLTLYDQIPVSRNGSITVSPEELSGGALDEAKGIVTWQMTLRPGEQRELSLRYKVKYPKGKKLVVE